MKRISNANVAVYPKDRRAALLRSVENLRLRVVVSLARGTIGRLAILNAFLVVPVNQPTARSGVHSTGIAKLKVGRGNPLVLRSRSSTQETSLEMTRTLGSAQERETLQQIEAES
jgi:hypothetical protein